MDVIISPRPNEIRYTLHETSSTLLYLTKEGDTYTSFLFRSHS